MPADHGYPRPLLRRRDAAMSLNGEWLFALDDTASIDRPDRVTWDRRIVVPFAPETPASGIGDTGFYRACWYRRQLDLRPPGPGQRVLLHFGAVDWSADVWVNRHRAASHDGGYTPFTLDITDLLDARGQQTIVVRAEDDPHDMAKPRGKQDWQREPHAIWYPRTTGIWQTVWLERVPETRIDELRWTPDADRFELALEVRVAGPLRDGMRLRVRLTRAGALVADDTYSVTAATVARRIALPDPGIDNERHAWLWRPSRPVLLDAFVELIDQHRDVVDRVESYTALRSVATDGDRFMLNGRPQKLRMTLDQGYWPDSGMTPPDDAALRRDVELAKQMGFNAVRKHQKIEDPRYLYWADRLGLMVWEEMPAAYAFDERAIQRLTLEWTRAVERDRNHPCIIAWVPFNESWGVPDLPSSEPQRRYVEGVVLLTQALDPTRPVIGNDGWEAIAGDIVGIHDYEQDAQKLAARLSPQALIDLLASGRLAGRRATLANHRIGDQPLVLSEFGGIAMAADAGAWGYSRSDSPAGFLDRYRALVAAARASEALAGWCYTQFADTYQEANGLLHADRTPKAPIDEIAAAPSAAHGDEYTSDRGQMKKRTTHGPPPPND